MSENGTKPTAPRMDGPGPGLTGMYDLRDEKQAQEYLKTVEIEYKFQCYHEKEADGCHRLADLLEAFKQDFASAKKLFEENCEKKNHGLSCYKAWKLNTKLTLIFI